jgi:hypothetical protein
MDNDESEIVRILHETGHTLSMRGIHGQQSVKDGGSVIFIHWIRIKSISWNNNHSVTIHFWGPENYYSIWIRHSSDGMLVGRYLANKFIESVAYDT